MEKRQRVLVDTALRLIRRGATANIKKILGKTHPADIAAVFQSLVRHDQKYLFDLIETDAGRAEVLSELKPDVYVPLLGCYEPAALVPILHEVASDDLADVLGNLPEEFAQAILQKMEKSSSEEVEELMRYGDDTAGGIMSPDFFSLHADVTAEEAIRALREDRDVEMAFYVYVLDDAEHLVGVVSLRQLVMAAPGARLRDIMEHDVISVRVDMDQEEVARQVARYNFLAVPVVDHANQMLGIVTVDDVVDVLREEATEDILKMAGAGQEMVETVSLWRNLRARFPWLIASCVGGILAALVMRPFLGALSDFGALALFIPAILGMGGNVGTQSSTIVVRGLATGIVHLGQSGRTVGREVTVGVVMGVAYGILVGLALVASMTLAAFVGAVVPLVFARLHIDPAVATGPFVTTSVDVLGTLTYFALALALAGSFPA
jgi:magnesium transporter